TTPAGSPPDCKFAPNIDPTSSSAHPVDIVRIFRMAEEPAPVLVATPHEALVATPHEAQKTVLDQTLGSKRQGDQYCARFYSINCMRVLRLPYASKSDACKSP